MGRPVMLGNGQMMIGLDENGLVHDFYYPYVGLENLTTARSAHHKIGVWANNKFSWVDDGTWTTSVDFESEYLFSKISMESSSLGIRLNFVDFLDHDHNTFVRRIKVTNTSSAVKDVRVFMHQVFQISRSGRADTALFVPDANYILDYKGRCALLIYGQNANGQSFDQYAVGNYGIEGKEGTFMDASDGELSNNAVEHGGVDSVIRFKFNLKPDENSKFDYWIIAAASQYDCETIQNIILSEGIDKRENITKDYWLKWLSIGANGLHAVDKQYLQAAKKSLMVIKAHTDRRGGVLASGDSSIFNYGRDYYCYCWPRDAAYAMWPLIRLGYTNEPQRFFEFCRDTMDRAGYLMHKYQPDRAIGSTWHPLVHENRRELAIQEDETAIVICMLAEYLDHGGDNEFVQSLYTSFIQPAAYFMAGFVDEVTNLPHASYDLWEQKFLTNTYTCFMVEHALNRAVKFAELFDFPDDGVAWHEVVIKMHEANKLLFDPERQVFRKGYYLQADGSLDFDNTIDASSMYAVLMFGNAKAEAVTLAQTVAAVEKYLVNSGPAGGVIRYENDNYMRQDDDMYPNPWLVCTLWLAQYYIQIKQLDKGKAILDWSLKHTLPSGIMSEQIDPQDGHAVGVAPLVWSHAEFINTVLDLADES